MRSADPLTRVGIVGLGLMGGSVARALANLDPRPRVTAYAKNPEDGRSALDAGVVDAVTATADEAVGDQDVVLYATPLGATGAMMAAHAHLWSGASVTDLVSLKHPLLRRARERGYAACYVGAHPMTGGTGSGFSASLDDAFVGRSVWIVGGDADPRHIGRICDFWTSIGARLRPAGAREHDRIMVWASHLPQLLATALARTMAARGVETADLGPGGRDMTRLAMSSPGMWRDLLGESAVPDARALEVLVGELEAMRRALEGGDVEAIGSMMEGIRRWGEGA